MNPLGITRSRVAADHALITPDTHVWAPLPGWVKSTAAVHISPVMGARFTQATVVIEAEGSSGAALPNVERVICGHLHRSIDVRFGGSIASTCPSPAHQVALDLAENAASQWVMEPPAFRVLALERGERLVSHLAASGTFDGPHPFHQAGALID